ncbi:MAG TPA: prolyl oligopeptidase family serine peptidase [Candidatus Krumholzibacteria bacterium]|nr:prolyl oligopeptidase family serine peptidase [Candidatus Krumholzibacteria bacterium]
MTRSFALRCLSLVLLMIAAALPAAAQDTALAYQMPDPALAAMIDAPPTPSVSVGPKGDWLLLIEPAGNPSIAEVAAPELRLAGLRINPMDNGQSRVRTATGLVFQRLKDDRQVRVTGLPDGARISGLTWSPDGSRVAFVAGTDDRLGLWTARAGEETARQLTPADMKLNGVYGRPYAWVGNDALVALAVPAGRGPAPVASYVPTGPVVQENLGRKAPARTLQDLLQNPGDEALFDHYATSRVVVLDLKGGARDLGEPAVYRDVSPSPDGKWLLVERVKHPYSYSLQEDSFPYSVEVWTRDGKPAHVVTDQPLQDQVPMTFGSVPTGPRSVGWRADAPAELVWAEALDGGDAAVDAPLRDKVLTQAAPFDGAPVELISLPLRYRGVTWGHDDLALVNAMWWKTRSLQVWRVHPGKPSVKPVLIEERSYQDRYNDPGRPFMHAGPFGRDVILTADGGRTVFLSGAGASPEGDRPFVDTWNVDTGAKERLFRSEAPYYEEPAELLDPGKRIVLTRRESQTEVPNYFVRDLKKGSLTQKTFFPDPTPQLAGISKEMITYKRSDGVTLTGTLYLPAGYDKTRDGPLPVLMWAYPTEFKSAKDAGQVTDSPYRFTRVGWWSPMMFLVRGYAVLDDPSMPIIGEGDTEPNDTFVTQLVASAQAAVDELVRRGVGDPDRMAVGGHSYGAFMTANLLAHSDLFRAGLPRSGAYNRTLTPFGFQAEERSFWEAPDVYFAMSPFMHADKINEPILIVHGDADNNSGTFPLQSERLYDAIKGHGGTARLVMLPAESHSYRARETIMHLMWETDRWLEQYVKNAPPRTLAPQEAGTH